VRNAFNRFKSLKPKDSEYPLEMLYNSTFDELERWDFILIGRHDESEGLRMKLIPVTVSIDENYSRDKVKVILCELISMIRERKTQLK
jgi:hypothetical protein